MTHWSALKFFYFNILLFFLDEVVRYTLQRTIRRLRRAWTMIPDMTSQVAAVC
jgi:hypothetical protein